jgi:hypothetical protein
LDQDNSEFQHNAPKQAPLANVSPLAFIFLSLAIVFFLYQIVGGSIAFLIAGDDMQAETGNMNLLRIVLSFGQFMFILVPSVILVILKGDATKQAFRLRAPDMKIFFLSLLGIILIQPFLQSFVYFQNEVIFSLPGGEFIKSLKDLFDSLEETTLGLVKATSVLEFLLVLFVIAVTPAISEEFLFRGLVFFNFEKIIPPSKAMFLTGVIFALFHFHPFNLIPLVILGVYLTFVTYHSGSIYTAIACHFLNNFISASAVYVLGMESFGNENMTGDEKIQYAVAGIASLILFIALLRFIRKMSSEIRTPDNFQIS